jgi:hypothetical protein
MISIISCQTDKNVFRAAAPEGVYQFEAETFRLVDADIIDDPAASDGKAVRIMTSRAFCSLDLDLPAGTYIARARALAADEDHDEFYLSSGKAVALLAPGDFGRFVYCPQVLEFTITAPGRGFLQFAAFSHLAPEGQTGALVDLLEVWEKAKWEASEKN